MSISDDTKLPDTLSMMRLIDQEILQRKVEEYNQPQESSSAYTSYMDDL